MGRPKKVYGSRFCAGAQEARPLAPPHATASGHAMPRRWRRPQRAAAAPLERRAARPIAAWTGRDGKVRVKPQGVVRGEGLG